MENKQEYKRTKEKNSRKKLIIVLVILFIVTCIALTMYFLIQKYNAEGQIEQFENAVKNNDYNAISETLTNSNHKFTEIESKNFVKYVKKDNNYKHFKTEINHIKNNIKQNKEYAVDLGSITDSNKEKILTVKKDGKKYIFLDKISFEPHLYDVYVKEYNNESVYEYALDDTFKSVAEPNKLSKVGTFFVGDYNIDTQKTIKTPQVSGKINGQLFFNTDNKDKNGKVIATDVFNQSWFKATLEHSNELDKDSLKLYVNGNPMEYKRNKVYGKYPNKKKSITVYAKGKVDDKTFKSNTIEVNQNHNQNTQHIKLSFDKSDVHRYRYETDDIKDKSKDFMKKYMSKLNKAYSKADYDYIKNYVEKDSKLNKEMKQKMKNKQNIDYKIKSYDEIKRNKNNLYVSVTKTNGKYKTKGTYTLKFDERGQFKVTSYKE